MLLKKRAKQSKNPYFHTPTKIPEHALNEGRQKIVFSAKVICRDKSDSNLQIITMLKLFFFIPTLCFSLQAWGQAEIDELICFPNYGREVIESGTKTIKAFVRSSNYVALKEVVSLDDQFRPKKIVYAHNLFTKDTSDIIHIDYSHLDQGIIYRVDSVFRSSARYQAKVYDERGNVIRIRNTDPKGGEVVKKIYKIGSSSIKVTTIYVNGKDTIYDQDALIPRCLPEIVVDDFGKSTIKFDKRLKVFVYDSTANEITTKGLDGAVLQRIALEHGLIKSIHHYGVIPSVDYFKYDHLGRVTLMEKRDTLISVLEHRQYLYKESKNRLSCIKITTPNTKSEICQQYPLNRVDQVVKIVENYSIDPKRGRVLNNTKHYTEKGFLVWYGYYISTARDRRQLIAEEYRLEK